MEQQFLSDGVYFEVVYALFAAWFTCEKNGLEFVLSLEPIKIFIKQEAELAVVGISTALKTLSSRTIIPNRLELGKKTSF